MSTAVVRLPSMNLIRTFVAVGRRMSITRASEDLFVTQSAVSRQIHTLEEALGIKLLVRAHRSVSFTPEGERLFRVAESAIGQLRDVVSAISVTRNRQPVTVSAPSGFAGIWLLPRMGDFQYSHPGIDLRISASGRLVDLRSEGIDLAIRYCPASAAPKGSIRLFGESLAPVAHPSLRSRPLERPEDLVEHFLLDFDDVGRPQLQWRDWLHARGWEDVKARGVLRFNQYDQVIHAALAGQGIALGRLELLRMMMKEGRLVALTSPRRLAEDGYAHWLIQGDSEPRKDVLDVMAWIRQQVAGMQDQDTETQTLSRSREAPKSHSLGSLQRSKKLV